MNVLLIIFIHIALLSCDNTTSNITENQTNEEKIHHIEIAAEKTAEGSSVEFIYTQDELKMMEKWKTKSLEDMFADAYNGDEAALHMMGLSFLYGTLDNPINITYANMFFAAAASLGFAPSLDKMTHMYLEDKPNPFLAMVYANLVIAHGHPEFIMGYHKQRNRIAHGFGTTICEEIEKLVSEKQIQILETIALRDQSKNMQFGVKLLHSNITSYDLLYDYNFWFKLMPTAGTQSE